MLGHRWRIYRNEFAQSIPCSSGEYLCGLIPFTHSRLRLILRGGARGRYGRSGAAKATEWTASYRYLGITQAARAALRTGSSNTIAVHVTDYGYPGYFDLGVVKNPLANPPVSGYERTPALSVLRDAVLQLVKERAVPAMTFAVMKRDTVVLAKGYGWKDKALSTPLGHDAVLRHASLDKYMTIDATVKLINAGTGDPVTGQAITRDTRVFPLLAARGLAPIAVLPLVGTTDVFLANEVLAARSPREPFYANFDPQHDRWMYLEKFLATGSSAEAYVRYLRGYHMDWGTQLLDPVTGAWWDGGNNGTAVFGGAMDGTWSVAAQRRHD